MGESGRFYTADGVLREEVGMREARAELLYPSVTEMLNGIAKPYALDQWTKQQLVVAGATTPRLDDENDDEFSERVMTAANEESKTATDRGTEVHRCIGRMLALGDNAGVPADLAEWLYNSIDPRRTNVEKVMVDHSFGYAGTCDFYGLVDDQPAIIDFKTQGVKVRERKTLTLNARTGEKEMRIRKDASPRFYESWPWQIAGYARALKDYELRMERIDAGDIDRIGDPQSFISIIINTNPLHPRAVPDENVWGYWVRRWKPAEMARGYSMLRILTDLWYTVHKFPRPGTAERDRWAGAAA